MCGRGNFEPSVISHQNTVFLGASTFPHRLYKNIRGHREHLISALIKKMTHRRIEVTILLFDILRCNSGERLLFLALGFPYFFWQPTEDHSYLFSEASPAQIDGLAYGLRL